MINVILFANLFAAPIALTFLCFVLALNIFGSIRTFRLLLSSAASVRTCACFIGILFSPSRAIFSRFFWVNLPITPITFFVCSRLYKFCHLSGICLSPFSSVFPITKSTFQPKLISAWRQLKKFNGFGIFFTACITAFLRYTWGIHWLAPLDQSSAVTSSAGAFYVPIIPRIEVF